MTTPELQLLFQALSSSAIAGGLIYTALQFRSCAGAAQGRARSLAALRARHRTR